MAAEAPRSYPLGRLIEIERGSLAKVVAVEIEKRVSSVAALTFNGLLLKELRMTAPPPWGARSK